MGETKNDMVTIRYGGYTIHMKKQQTGRSGVKTDLEDIISQTLPNYKNY